MVDESKRNRMNKRIAWTIAVLAAAFFLGAFYMGAGTH